MTKRSIFAFLTIFFAIFSLISCEWEFGSGDSFEYNLQGTWESVDKSVYSGRLTITYNTIKIEGYYESQTGYGNPSHRPFRDFSKDVVLKGYSEDGKIFIENRNTLQSISYGYYFYNFRQDERLEFYFGGRSEELRKLK